MTPIGPYWTTKENMQQHTNVACVGPWKIAPKVHQMRQGVFFAYRALPTFWAQRNFILIVYVLRYLWIPDFRSSCNMSCQAALVTSG